MPDAEFGRVLMLITSIYAALAERGWEALLSPWHAGVAAQSIGHRRGYEHIAAAAPAPATSPLARQSQARWRRLCTARGRDPRDARAAAEMLVELGLLVEKRRLVFWRVLALADPMPDAASHPALDPEAKEAATLAAELHRVQARIGALLEAGAGRHEARSIVALAADAGTDETSLRLLMAEADAWRVVDQTGGGVVLEQIMNDELIEMLDAIEALPEDP